MDSLRVCGNRIDQARDASPASPGDGLDSDSDGEESARDGGVECEENICDGREGTQGRVDSGDREEEGLDCEDLGE